MPSTNLALGRGSNVDNRILSASVIAIFYTVRVWKSALPGRIEDNLVILNKNRYIVCCTFAEIAIGLT